MKPLEEQIFENRLISIHTEINAQMADLVMKELLIMDDDSHKPITLYINSPGGDVLAGLQIIDTINSLKSYVITVNTGLCASMGAVILSSGAERLALPHSRIMIHEVSSGAQGKYRDLEASFENTKAINKIAMSMLAKNCNKTYEEIMEDTRQDFWMNAEDALKYGIVDKIIGREDRRIMKEDDDKKEAA